MKRWPEPPAEGRGVQGLIEWLLLISSKLLLMLDTRGLGFLR